MAAIMTSRNCFSKLRAPLRASLKSKHPFSAAAVSLNLNTQSQIFEQTYPVDLVSHYATVNRESPTEYKLIVPKFFLREEVLDRTLFEIDCQGYDMTKTHEVLEAQMHQTFKDVGLVVLKNTGLTQLQDMRKWAKIILQHEVVYTGGANPRKAIEPNVYDVGAPTSAWIHYHHEMAYVSKSPFALSFFCGHTPAPDRGWTYVSDNVQATEDILLTEFGQKLKEKGICYIRNLTDKSFYQDTEKSEGTVYNHWQDSFGVEDPEMVEPLAKQRGLEIEWDIREGNRFLKTKYYVSAFEYHPETDKNLLYASVADDFMWFDAWKGIGDTTHVDERPLRLTYGDDTDLTQEDRQEFVDIYDRYGMPLRWSQGDVAIACNYRFAHGRPAIEMYPGEKRVLGVLIGRTFDRVGHVDGKW